MHRSLRNHKKKTLLPENGTTHLRNTFLSESALLPTRHRGQNFGEETDRDVSFDRRSGTDITTFTPLSRDGRAGKVSCGALLLRGFASNRGGAEQTLLGSLRGQRPSSLKMVTRICETPFCLNLRYFRLSIVAKTLARKQIVMPPLTDEAARTSRPSPQPPYPQGLRTLLAGSRNLPAIQTLSQSEGRKPHEMRSCPPRFFINVLPHARIQFRNHTCTS